MLVCSDFALHETYVELALWMDGRAIVTELRSMLASILLYYSFGILHLWMELIRT